MRSLLLQQQLKYVNVIKTVRNLRRYEKYMKLKGKFESKYTAQQLRLWANMLQVETWIEKIPRRIQSLATMASLMQKLEVLLKPGVV